ncbi:sugar phosphate isomerase/epimerase family protein [Nesterenkonia alba]|uniref:sugar phosphate isomerase/epimerase family protein n=1 Tax=Nesterenkonia alba TaxID=515814 RepID=UPI0003B5A3EE|nr:sugar phosphate isomerase/epimerase family protein [Nesterenkonia alba]
MRWKFAFSTLGMPGAGLDEVIDTAHAHGCAGVELRVHDDEFLRPHTPLTEARRIGERIQAAGLEISALAGYVRVCSTEESDDAVVASLRRLIDLAAETGAHGIRVFPGGEPGHHGGAQSRIATVLPQLRQTGVQLLVETHDTHPTAAEALQLVKDLGDPHHAAVLWDALHPWRSGETPEQTKATLGEYFAYFQVKDVIMDGEAWTPVLTGAGQIPLDEHARLLQDYCGWVSLEWEKAWHPQIEPLADALASTAEWFRRHNPGTMSP